MYHFMRACRLILCISMPLAIVLLCSNIVLRIPATYVYHFNDTEVIDDLGIDMYGSEMADGIAGYLNSTGDGSEFQMYIENGSFKDPVFDETDSAAMAKVKTTLRNELILGLVFLAVFIVDYIVLVKREYRDWLRRAGVIAAVVSIALSAVMFGLFRSGTFVRKLYDTFVGVDLSENTLIGRLLDMSFLSVAGTFALIVALIAIAVFLFIHLQITREEKLFFD
ncbi:MAG: hypothetical protein ACOYJO_01130 [Eubacterium sp.]|jgi:hypothetical protein